MCYFVELLKILKITFNCILRYYETVCDTVYQWLAAGLFSPGTPDSPKNKAERHAIPVAEI